MKKRLIAFLLVLVLLVPTALAAAVTYYRVNTSSLKLRQLPDEKSTVLDSFRQDFALTVQRKVDSNWSYVTFTNGSEGYVLTRYLAKSKTYRAYITTDYTPIRTGPAYNFSNVGTLARGAKVTVLTHGTKYDYVSSSVGRGYVLNARLSKKYIKPSGKPSTPASQDVYYTAWIVNPQGPVKLRTAPSSKANVINSYPSGTQVTVWQHNQTWDYIEVDGNFGYMLNAYLSKNKPAPTPTVKPTDPPFVSYEAYITSINKEGVNMRRHAGKGYAAIMVLPYGAKVTVLKEGDWYKIRYNNRVGYVEREYIQLTPPDPKVTPKPKPTEEPDPTPVPFSPYKAEITCKAGEKVNIRAGEGKGYRHLARLSPGEVVDVIEPGTKYPATWVKVRYGKIEGYVMLKYLKRMK